MADNPQQLRECHYKYKEEEEISSGKQSAAGELFTGPPQSLLEMSDGHCGTLLSDQCRPDVVNFHELQMHVL